MYPQIGIVVVMPRARVLLQYAGRKREERFFLVGKWEGKGRGKGVGCLLCFYMDVGRGGERCGG